jgi:hypothetical protein
MMMAWSPRTLPPWRLGRSAACCIAPSARKAHLAHMTLIPDFGTSVTKGKPLCTIDSNIKRCGKLFTGSALAIFMALVRKMLTTRAVQGSMQFAGRRGNATISPRPTGEPGLEIFPGTITAALVHQDVWVAGILRGGRPWRRGGFRFGGICGQKSDARYERVLSTSAGIMSRPVITRCAPSRRYRPVRAEPRPVVRTVTSARFLRVSSLSLQRAHGRPAGRPTAANIALETGSTGPVKGLFRHQGRGCGR